MKGLINEETLFVNKNYFAADLEKSISKIKTDFRKRHNIPEDATVVFVAPGNEANETEFCIENIRKGVKEFILKYSTPTSLSPKAPGIDKYCTVMSLHKGSHGEKYVTDFLTEKEWTGKLVIVSE